jgi:hypothetical protein
MTFALDEETNNFYSREMRFENRVLRRIFGPKREKVTGD